MTAAACLEAAPTGRAKCRGCGQAIAKGTIRLGERVPNPFADDEGAETTQWYHPWCAAFRRPEVLIEALAQSTVDLADRGALDVEAALGLAHRRVVRADAASRAPSGRATCRACKELVDKDTWRIALVFYEDGRFTPSGYIHARCALEYFETPALMPRVRHFSPGLDESALADLEAEIRAGR
jgi:Poly(ADP-ribose) polymerase and DNA-Ligase Zn-finger region